jgi:hypothetical protein
MKSGLCGSFVEQHTRMSFPVFPEKEFSQAQRNCRNERERLMNLDDVEKVLLRFMDKSSIERTLENFPYKNADYHFMKIFYNESGGEIKLVWSYQNNMPFYRTFSIVTGMSICGPEPWSE